MMYGSTIRIKAIPFNYYLHSHEVRYPLGSGQQSVTGFQMDNDYNSLWTIKEPHHDQIKTYSINCLTQLNKSSAGTPSDWSTLSPNATCTRISSSSL